MSMSALLILLAHFVSILICRIKYSKDLKIPYDEAVEKGNVVQEMSSRDIDDIFNSLN